MAETSVKLLEFEVANAGLLKIEQIGSGIGVILYNAATKVGVGMHILAPHCGSAAPKNPIMYADTAIPYVMEQLTRRGVTSPFLVAIAGGASLLKCHASIGSSQRMVEAVKQALSKASLSVKVEETGGAKVRSMLLDVDGGKIKIN